MLWNRCPYKHRCLGFFDAPSKGTKPFTEYVTTAAIHVSNLFYAFLRPFQCGDGCHLNRCEHAVIEVRLYTCQRGNQFRVAYHETDAPTRHVVTFRQGEKFYSNLFGARHFHNRRRFIAIKHNVGIGQIVDHPYLVFLGDSHHFLEKLQLHTLGSGVAREIQHQHFGLGPGIFNRLFQLTEKIDIGGQGYMADVCPGDNKAVGMNRVRRIRHQHCITGTNRGQGQMCQPLFRANGNNGLGFRVQFHLETVFVPITDSTSQTRNTTRHRVTVGIASLSHFNELINDMFGGRLVWISHTKIHNIFAARARFGLQVINNIKHIRRQAINSREIFKHGNR